MRIEDQSHPDMEVTDNVRQERDALLTRVRDLEAEFARVRHEIEHALRFPEINLLTLCRIATIARRVVRVH